MESQVFKAIPLGQGLKVLLDEQRQNNRQKAFRAKTFIQINNKFTIRSKKHFPFFSVRAQTYVIFRRHFGSVQSDRLIKNRTGLNENLIVLFITFITPSCPLFLARVCPSLQRFRNTFVRWPTSALRIPNDTPNL